MSRLAEFGDSQPQHRTSQSAAILQKINPDCKHEEDAPASLSSGPQLGRRAKDGFQMARHNAAVKLSPAQAEAQYDEGDVGNEYSTCDYN
jgi:hypothetical protein